MRNNAAARNLTTSGSAETVGTFGLSMDDATHLMRILRDTLYTDRVLAVLREYASNAWDAHRTSGNDKPIKVTLPTSLAPTLIIRDYGPGLSDNDVMKVYTQYGASTKRDTNSAVGMLGIGCKSAFAYTDSFTVTSWHGGKRRMYVAVLDESDAGEMRLMDESDCGDDTGIEIKVPVKQNDVFEFQQKAQFLFRFFRPLPEINIDLPALPKTATSRGYFDFDSRQWVAVMGCVPYRVDLSHVKDISDGLRHVGGVLFFDIGDVEITASREDLKYTENTINALGEKMIGLQDAYLEELATNLKGKNPWQQRITLRNLRSVMEFPYPKEYRHLRSRNSGQVNTTDTTPNTFRWGSNDIYVTPDAKIVVHDDKRPLAGFDIPQFGAVVKPLRKHDIKDVMKELDEWLKAAHLTGIEIVYTSDMTYDDYRATSSQTRTYSKKYSAKMFRYLFDHQGYSTKKSSRWEIVDRVPTDEDVYVGLYRFEATAPDWDFTSFRSRDRQLADALGILDKFPEIYGYKDDVVGKAKGVRYSEWRKSWFAENIPADKRAMLEGQSILEVFGVGNNDSRYSRILPLLEKSLGTSHLMTKMVARIVEAQRVNSKLDLGSV